MDTCLLVGDYDDDKDHEDDDDNDDDEDENDDEVENEIEDNWNRCRLWTSSCLCYKCTYPHINTYFCTHTMNYIVTQN